MEPSRYRVAALRQVPTERLHYEALIFRLVIVRHPSPPVNILNTGERNGYSLAEFAATMLHKVSPPATADAVMRGLDALTAIRLIVPDAELVRRAVQARAAYGIHFYDGMIVAAAERAGCQRILSEDLNAGQEYFGVTVSNPFR